MAGALTITTISWIDRKNLPMPGIGNLIEAARGGDSGWDDRTIIGLIATCNPPPPAPLGDLTTFRAKKEYRAVTSIQLKPDLSGLSGDAILDPGWTPPFDKSKLPLLARLKSPPAKALKASHSIGKCAPRVMSLRRIARSRRGRKRFREPLRCWRWRLPRSPRSVPR